MDINNLTSVYNQNPTLQGQYTLQQYLDMFGQGATPPTTGTPPPVQITPSDPNAPKAGIINAGINQYQGGGGNDKYQGGGAFGNLDISDTKTFQKDVYNSKTGKFEQQTVTGYKNPTLGSYQTFKGKNINHGGINFKGVAGTVMDMMGMGPELDENGYYDGQISGTFTGFKPSDFKDIKSFYKAKKDRQTFMDNNKIEIDRVKKEKLMEEIRKMEAAKAVKMQKNNFVPPSGITGGDNQYDYTGRSNQYGTHDATKTKEEAATNQESYRGKNGGRVKSYFKGGIVSLRGR